MWVNEITHPCFMNRTYLFSYKSFMADRIGLDGTMLHYLAGWQAVVSVHRPVRSKITLTYSLTWQTNRCTPPENGFQGAIKCQDGPFLGFAQVFSAFIVRKNCQNGLLKNSYVYCRLSINHVRGHIDDPPTLK